MKKKFYLEPSNIFPDEMIVLTDDDETITRRSCFISTVIRAKEMNSPRFNEHYEWLKENHPEYLI